MIIVNVDVDLRYDKKHFFMKLMSLYFVCLLLQELEPASLTALLKFFYTVLTLSRKKPFTFVFFTDLTVRYHKQTSKTPINFGS